MAEQRIHQLLSLKKTLELVPTLRDCLASLQSGLLADYAAKLCDPRFEMLLVDITGILHPDATLQKGALDMKIQKCFAVKPGLDGLLDVARRTYSETMEDIQSAPWL